MVSLGEEVCKDRALNPTSNPVGVGGAARGVEVDDDDIPAYKKIERKIEQIINRLECMCTKTEKAREALKKYKEYSHLALADKEAQALLDIVDEKLYDIGGEACQLIEEIKKLEELIDERVDETIKHLMWDLEDE